jgi:hypothetical protein
MADDPQDYLRFNIGSIDGLIKQKLSAEFPDVTQRGSSATILSEAVSSVFSLLMFQLNRTAANSSFTKTNSVESLINQTKMLGYNPVGHQSSSMFLDIATSRTLSFITYSIPRYSSIETSSGRFSTDRDLTFTNEFAHESTVFEDQIFRGGSYVEYPIIPATGEKNQKYAIFRGDNKIDHNSVDVYIKEPSGQWEEFEQVDSLFLSSGSDKSFESRYNDRGSYDITFGDGINGYSPPANSEIAIYYLSVNNDIDVIALGAVESEPLGRLNTTRFNSILLDVVDTTKSLYLNDLATSFVGSNTSTSTPKSDPETVAEIRRNAPSTFKSQNRLVTGEDYRSFVLNNFAHFVSDVLILSNEEYLENYIKYYTNLGLDKPFEENRALFNQIYFSSSVNFNNVYLFLIPKNGNYISNVQKQLIVDKMEKTKTLSAEIIPSDAIIINFGIATPIDSILFTDLQSSGLTITKSPNTNRSEEDLKLEVINNIELYFAERSLLFNQTIDVSQINSKLLSIDGVRGIETYNGDIVNSGLSLYEWNPSYPERISSAPPTNVFTGIFVPRFVKDDILNQINFK